MNIQEMFTALGRLRPENDWISASLSVNIEDICRRYKVFNDTYPNEFLNFLNLKYGKGEYSPCPKTKRKVYYLIFRLSEYVNINKDNRVLDLLGIKLSGEVSLRKKHKTILKYWESKIIEACGEPYSYDDYINHRTGCIGGKKSKGEM